MLIFIKHQKLRKILCGDIMLLKNTIRKIKRSFGRYASLIVIVFIGIAIFTSLQLCTPNIRSVQQDYYDFENSQINRQRIDGNSLSRRERHASPLERREERGSSLFSSPAKISLSATTLSVSWKIKKLLLRSVLHRFISSSSVGYEEMINERARSADWQVGMKYEVKSEDSCIFAASSSIARTKRSTRDSESSLNSFNPSLGCRSAKYEAK